MSAPLKKKLRMPLSENTLSQNTLAQKTVTPESFYVYYVCTELLSPSVMKTVGSCYVTFPYIEVFYMNIKGSI